MDTMKYIQAVTRYNIDDDSFTAVIYYIDSKGRRQTSEKVCYNYIDAIAWIKAHIPKD